MEGKTVILSVLILSLVMAQIQVEAKSCCPSTTARNVYNTCRATGQSREICAQISGCRIVSGSKCPSCCPKENLENSGDAVNEYCKLGCASSVCGALSTVKNFDAREIVNEVLESCNKACSTLCAKGSKSGLDQIA